MSSEIDKAQDIHQIEGNGEIKPNNDERVLRSAFADYTSWEIVKTFWRLYGIGLGVSLGGMYAGYCGSAVGNIVANPGFLQQFGTVHDSKGQLQLNASYVSLWSGMSFVGQIVFQCVSPFITDKFGRRVSMWLLVFFMLIAIIIEIVSKNWQTYLVAKLFSGFSAAFLGTGVMTYMSEIAITQIRGALLGAFSLSFALGQLFSAVGLQILVETTPLKFRNAFYSEFVIFGLFAGVLIFIPESPPWLSAKGNHEKAKRALKRLVGNVKGYDVEYEYAVLQQEIEESQEKAKKLGKSDWSALFKWVNFKRCIAATLPFTYQNFVGTPLIFGQTTYFFQLAGLQNPFQGAVIIQVILIVGIILSFYFVERVGRRFLVLWAGAAMGLIDVAVGALGFAKVSSAYGAGLLTLCSIWVFLYSLSLAPIGWTAVVEVSSPQLRAKTAAVATVLQSLTGILFNYTVPLMISTQYAGWGSKIGFFFGGLTFLFWIPCYFLYPETKGRTYTELDELYARNVPPRKFHKTTTMVTDAPHPQPSDLA